MAWRRYEVREEIVARDIDVFEDIHLDRTEGLVTLLKQPCTGISLQCHLAIKIGDVTKSGVAGLLMAAMCAAPASAQEREQKEPRRTRVGVGAQFVPSYPGADSLSIRPLVDVARARGTKPFEFEAPDESFGFPLLRSDGFDLGPALNFEGSRTASDVGVAVPKVSATFEAGAFAQYAFSDSFRLRAEVRKGVGGHNGVIANLGADYVARDADKWLLSIGPRVTITDGRYNRAYFGVRPEDSASSALPQFEADGGVQAVGATVGYIKQLNPSWGIYSYAKYERLVADAADSPIVRLRGSRNQLSGGLALTYTFGSAL